jgi:hypothetical protein
MYIMSSVTDSKIQRLHALVLDLRVENKTLRQTLNACTQARENDRTRLDYLETRVAQLVYLLVQHTTEHSAE